MCDLNLLSTNALAKLNTVRANLEISFFGFYYKMKEIRARGSKHDAKLGVLKKYKK